MGGQRKGWLYLYFFLGAGQEEEGEDVALEHLVVQRSGSLFPLVKQHACVTGAYRSEGSASVYQFSVFKKSLPCSLA